MSNRITTLCRPLEMTPAQKSVLMCLADRANEDGLAFPSVPGICEWTCLGRTAVIDAVRALEGLDFLAISRVSGKKNRAVFDLQRLVSRLEDAGFSVNEVKSANGYLTYDVRRPEQSASRTGSARGRVRQTDPTSPPPGRVPVRLPDGTRSPGGPEASVHQGCTTEAPPQGAGVPATPAAAGAGCEIPRLGDPQEWRRLASLRKTTSEDWAKWAKAADELHPGGGESLNAAIRELAANPHWKNLPGPTKARPSRGRMTLTGMDYTKRL